MRWRKIKIASRHEPTLGDLGFDWAEFDDPIPFWDKLYKLHGKNTRPFSIIKKRVPEGEIYEYSINVKPGSRRSSDHRNKLTIFTPNLDLPHFFITPIPRDADGKTSALSKIIKRIFPARYRRKDQKPVQLGLDETFEMTHVIKTSDEAGLKRLLTRTRLERLKDLRVQYIIECNETDISIEDPFEEDQGWEYLVQAERDLREICWIFSSE